MAASPAQLSRAFPRAVCFGRGCCSHSGHSQGWHPAGGADPRGHRAGALPCSKAGTAAPSWSCSFLKGSRGQEAPAGPCTDLGAPCSSSAPLLLSPCSYRRHLQPPQGWLQHICPGRLEEDALWAYANSMSMWTPYTVNTYIMCPKIQIWP